MAEPRTALRAALLLSCTLGVTAAWAQSAPQSAAAASAAERAQKESDRTMYWIRILADKPAPTKAAPAPRPAVAATTAAPTPAAPRPAAETREKVKVAAASPAAAPTAAGGTSARAPLAQAQEPAPAPVVGVPDPATSSTGIDNTPSTDTPGTAPLVPLDVAPPPEPDQGLIQIKSVQPDFPGNVVLKVRKGNVEVQFEVEPGGTVVDATVVQSSNPRLNAAAVEAVKQWRFKPGPKGHIAAVNLVFDIDNEK